MFFSSLVFVSYDSWKTKHYFHHSHIGDLSVVDLNRTTFCTVEEYNNYSPFKKFIFRILRDPFVFFTFVTFYHFFIQQRYLYLSYFYTHVTNFYFMGWFSCLFVYNYQLFVDECIGVSIGAMLTMAVFHLHHEVNLGYMEDKKNWNYDQSLYFSSTYAVTPFWLKWATCGMEAHMIHHIYSKIPCYKLEQVYLDAKERKEFWKGTTFIQGRKLVVSMFNTMWNSETQRFQSFDLYNRLLNFIGLSNKVY
jgi:acyl-lipid omega-6 desaturase (Delta-12 desaturase)